MAAMFRFWVTAMLLGAMVPLGVGAVFAVAQAIAGHFSNANIRQRRRSAGKCEHCTYSLVGNISGVCPECGNNAPPVSIELVKQPMPASLHLRRWTVVSGIALGIVLLGALLFSPVM